MNERTVSSSYKFPVTHILNPINRKPFPTLHGSKSRLVTTPACKECGRELIPNFLRSTPRGHYYDGEVLCGYCKGERDRKNADD